MAWNARRSQAHPPSRGTIRVGAHSGLPHKRHSTALTNALPDIATARLPATYQAAQKAIAKCSRIDECKTWSDKAAALASYARQAKDHTLCVMAERIQARAIRRCGELLKQVPSGQGSKNQHGELRDGTVTRQEAALNAGLSERQKVTALRVATLSAPQFEQLVESDSPPTVTQLADLGRHAHPPQPSAVRPDPIRAAKAHKMFSTILEFCEQNDPAELAHTLASQDQQPLRKFVSSLDAWLDTFMAHLSHGVPE
jgi:hypothetical protein